MLVHLRLHEFDVIHRSACSVSRQGLFEGAALRWRQPIFQRLEQHGVHVRRADYYRIGGGNYHFDTEQRNQLRQQFRHPVLLSDPSLLLALHVSFHFVQLALLLQRDPELVHQSRIHVAQ